MTLEAFGGHPIKLNWGFIGLNVPLGTSLHVMSAGISLKTRVAMDACQQTFPDEYHFRTRLIHQALTYESYCEVYHVESVRLRGIHVMSFDLLKRE